MKNNTDINENNSIKMDINIIETQGYINLTNALDVTDLFFQISKEDIAEIIIVDDERYSKWIDILIKLDCATNETFYQLAVIIQRINPNTNINWAWQFYDIESKEYNDREYHKNNPYPEDEFTFESFTFDLGYYISNVNKKYIATISEILAEKFESYNLNPNF